jgi:hypothetical protein
LSLANLKWAFTTLNGGVTSYQPLVCTFFWLLTTSAYVRYVRRGGARNYALVLVLYAAALLSKPIAVSLPFTLLLLDFWPLGRYGALGGVPGRDMPLLTELEPGPVGRGGYKDAAPSGASQRRVASWGTDRLLLEKAPLLVLCGLACWITVMAQVGWPLRWIEAQFGVRREHGPCYTARASGHCH